MRFLVCVNFLVGVATLVAAILSVTSAHGGSEDASSLAHGDAAERLNVVSWRLKRGIAKVDYGRISSILATADVALLQNVEFNEKGETPLTLIANALEVRRKEKVCKGWFKNSKGERGKYAFIWRDSKVGFVEKNGALRETCSGHPVITVTESGKEPATITLYLKSNHRLFVLTSISFDEAPKRPKNEISGLFRNYSATGWGVIFAGDLKTPAKSPALADVKKWSFKPAMAPSNTKRGQDNFWFKNLSLIAANPVNLFEEFPEMSELDLYGKVSDSFPIRAEFTFSEKEAEDLQVQLVSKRNKAPASVGAPRVAQVPPAFPGPLSRGKLSNLNEDIEHEALDEDGGKPQPKSNLKAKKDKKSN